MNSSAITAFYPMKIAPLFLLTGLAVALSAAATEFRSAELVNNGAGLTIFQPDGSSFLAPMLKNQDSFAAPAVSSNHRYAGWLALYPDLGASYSQPLHVVVFDASKRIYRFSGDFGMVFGWCFTKDSDAVVYRFTFPHGATSVGFEMRRIKDGKLLRRFLLDPTSPNEDEQGVIRAKAPLWTRCAQDGAVGQ